MVIAVYANFSGYSSSDPYLRFVKTLVNQLARAYSNDSFYWVREEVFPDSETYTANLKIIFIEPPGKLLYKYNLNRKINQQIKKIKADALLAIDAIINSKVRQCVLIGSLTKKFQTTELLKLTSIFCLSETMKSDL